MSLHKACNPLRNTVCYRTLGLLHSLEDSLLIKNNNNNNPGLLRIPDFFVKLFNFCSDTENPSRIGSGKLSVLINIAHKKCVCSQFVNLCRNTQCKSCIGGCNSAANAVSGLTDTSIITARITEISFFIIFTP